MWLSGMAAGTEAGCHRIVPKSARQSGGRSGLDISRKRDSLAELLACFFPPTLYTVLMEYWGVATSPPSSSKRRNKADPYPKTPSDTISPKSSKRYTIAIMRTAIEIQGVGRRSMAAPSTRRMGPYSRLHNSVNTEIFIFGDHVCILMAKQRCAAVRPPHSPPLF